MGCLTETKPEILRPQGKHLNTVTMYKCLSVASLYNQNKKQRHAMLWGQKMPQLLSHPRCLHQDWPHCSQSLSFKLTLHI